MAAPWRSVRLTTTAMEMLRSRAIYQYINSSWQQLGTDIDGEAQLTIWLAPSHSQPMAAPWRSVRLATTAMDLTQVTCASTNTSTQAGSS